MRPLANDFGRTRRRGEDAAAGARGGTPKPQPAGEFLSRRGFPIGGVGCNFPCMAGERRARCQRQGRASARRARHLLVACLATATALSCLTGCKDTTYRLDVLEEIHDENGELNYQIRVRRPIERVADSITDAFGGSPPDPAPRRISDPDKVVRRALARLGSADQPRGAATYARSVGVLSVLAETARNPFERTLALGVLAFQYEKNDRPGFREESLGGKEADAVPMLDEFPRLLDAWKDAPESRDRSALEALQGSGPRPLESPAAKELAAAIRVLSDVRYDTTENAAAVLRLFSELHARRRMTALREELERGIHRVAPQAITLACEAGLTYRGAAHVREEAAETLGRLGNVAAVPRLNTALARDRDESVRRRAAWALGALEDERAVPFLVDRIENDEDAGVRWRARKAATRIVGEDLGEEGAPWRAWWRDRPAPTAGESGE